MKDYVLELVSKKTGYNAKLNIMREYLQAYVLRILHDQGIFHTTAFLGGTALRFLYNMPRFSEDLDFSAAGGKNYDFPSLIKKLTDDLASAGYNVTASHKKEKTVLSSFVRFEDLMYEAEISSHRDQKFSIKLEIDTDPPAGAALKTVVVNKYFPIAFLSYDLPSLFAGKVHALLSRKYTKGRDLFDLGWYLSKWRDLVPNLMLLKNALKRTGWKGEVPTEDNWRDMLYKTVKDKDWKRIRQDVESFLENPADLNILTQENVLSLLKI